MQKPLVQQQAPHQLRTPPGSCERSVQCEISMDEDYSRHIDWDDLADDDDPTWINHFFRQLYFKPKWSHDAYPDVCKEAQAKVKAELRRLATGTKKKKTRSASKTNMREAHVERINKITRADIAIRKSQALDLFQPLPYRYADNKVI